MSRQTRIASAFARLKEERRAGLAAFVMAGDPDMEASARILESLPRAGADMVELGMAFSDPMADGPAIQASGERARRAGASLKKTLEMTSRFRKSAPETPLILMGYANPVHRYGMEGFARDAAKAGADGVIIVDMPPEEDAPLRRPLAREGLAMIRLAAPNSDEARLSRILEKAEGFLYYVAITGVTGGPPPNMKKVARHMAAIRKRSPLPMALGFGVKTAAQAEEAARHAEMVVVGSAIAQKIGGASDPETEAFAFVRELKKGIERAGGGRRAALADDEKEMRKT